MTVYFFDTETTGTEENDQIIEAAYANVVGLPHDKKWFSDGYVPFNERFNPSVNIKLGAMAIHNIVPSDLTDKEPSELFSLPADAQYIVGHNVDFDWRMSGSHPDINRICTLAIARAVLPDLDSHSQSALAYYFFGDKARDMVKNAHSALDDVRTLINVFKRLLPLMNVGNSWDAVYQFSEQARIPTVMPFGKHKGLPISEVPADYKQWYLKQAERDPYLVTAFTQK